MSQTEELKKMLQAQLMLFRKVGDLNTALLAILNTGKDLEGFKIKLSEKNSLLDEIQKKSGDAAPLISDWMQVSHSMKDTPEYGQIEQLLNQIEQIVERSKSLDEEMVAVFNRYLGADKPQAHNDIINAYRAMR